MEAAKTLSFVTSGHCHLAKSRLVKCHLADTYWWHQIAEMSEPVILTSIEWMGAKLGGGVWAVDFEL